MKSHVIPATKLLAPSDRYARRGRRTALALFIAALLIGLVWLQNNGLQRASFSTGYALLGAVLFLISFHWRKMAPSLPLGKVSVWLQYHLYVGYLTIVLFGLHVSLRMPTGIFETTLFAVFVIVTGSGVYGLYLTRTTPRHLRMLPEEVIYERIPQLQREVAREARQRIVAGSADSAVLTDFYKSHLAAWFERGRGAWYFLNPNSRQRRRLISHLRELDRFLSASRRVDCRELERLVCRKDDLDFHAALQGRLKVWMYFHIGFSYSLLGLSFVHGILAHAFHGGVR